MFQIRRTYELSEETLCPDQPGFLPVSDFIAQKGAALTDMTYIVPETWIAEGSAGLVTDKKSGGVYYPITINVGQPVLLSAYAQFDFISTDIYLDIQDSANKVIGRSDWDLASEGDEFNFISSTEVVNISAGTYTLRIWFNASIEKILALLPDAAWPRCIKFDFNIAVSARTGTET